MSDMINNAAISNPTSDIGSNLGLDSGVSNIINEVAKGLSTNKLDSPPTQNTNIPIDSVIISSKLARKADAAIPINPTMVRKGEPNIGPRLARTHLL
jgi:hypothetical protein